VAPLSSTLELPVLAGPAPISRSPQLASPRSGADQSASSPVVWRLERDVVGRTTRAVVDHGGVSDLGNGTRLDERYGGTVGVSSAEDGVAWAQGKNSFEVTWPEVTAKAEARCVMESDPETYNLKLDLDVWADGELIASRNWNRRFPRKLQ
jgi:hypothetical protein